MKITLNVGSKDRWLRIAIGLVLIGFAFRDSSFAGRHDAQIEIRVNGLDLRTGRDVLLPRDGWVLHVEVPADLPPEIRDTLEITLREERTGTTIPIKLPANLQQVRAMLCRTVKGLKDAGRVTTGQDDVR